MAFACSQRNGQCLEGDATEDVVPGKTEKATQGIGLWTLPDRIIVEFMILAHFQVEELCNLKITCRRFRELANRRFLHTIVPPPIVDRRLPENGPMVLYIEYRRWLSRWDALESEALRSSGRDPIQRRRRNRCKRRLRRMSNQIDGFFSLAPWSLPFGNPETRLWLQNTAYGGPGIPSGGNPSPFYQQRERDDEDVFRRFYSTPAGAHDRVCAPTPTRRFVLQPLNVRRPRGGAFARLPDLPDYADGALRLAARLLSCYMSACDVSVAPPRAHSSAGAGRAFFRRDLQGVFRDGEPVYQLSTAALHGARIEEDRGAAEAGLGPAFLLLVVAAHLFPSGSEDMAWCYSTRLAELPRGDGRIEAWCLSTHQGEAFLPPGPARTRQLVANVMYAALVGGADLDVCESKACVMNNADSVAESEARPGALCPTCVRKLQLKGLVGDDVPARLAAAEEALVDQASAMGWEQGWWDAG